MFDPKIKKLKREAVISRILIPILQETFKENLVLKNFFIEKLELSKESGLCNIYVFGGSLQSDRDAAMKELKLLGPSTRTALARILKSRYTPEIRFVFNDNYHKLAELNSVLLRVNQDLKQIDTVNDES